MGDLYLGFALITALSLVIFLATVRFSREWTTRTLDGLALFTVFAIFYYIQCIWYDTRLARWLPFSNLVVVGNWFPLAAAVLAGVAWRRVPGRVIRKVISVAAVTAAAFYTAVSPLQGSSPVCANAWTPDGICLQTTAGTCTPACAATLLRQAGINATEQEMAELCLTRSGTTWQGLYRGLKRKTAGSEWDVEVLNCQADELLTSLHGPLILSVGLPNQPTANQQLATAEWGWQPGVGHSVILLEKTRHGRLAVADPTPGIGREDWTAEDLKLLFRGTAMRLVRR